MKLFELAGRLTSGMALIISALFMFLATVTYLAAAPAIAIIAPILAWSLAGCGLLVVVVATMAFGLNRCQRIALGVVGFWRDFKGAQIAIKRDYAEFVFRSRVMSATAEQVEGGLLHAGNFDGVGLTAFPRQAVNQIEAIGSADTEHRQDLLPALADCPNVLVIGGKGRGKTSLLQWLEEDRLQRGNVVTVLDSHAKPAQWGGQVIGAGREYESIAAAMIDLNTMLDNRYVKYSKGKDDFTIIDTFIDEFTLLPDKLKAIGFDVQDYSKSALTEGRKVAMNCVWGIHSDRAEALGLKGAKDLLECFDAIVYLKKVRGDYYAMINFGEGIEDVKYNHPGLFAAKRTASPIKILPPPSAIAISNWPKPKVVAVQSQKTDEEKAIIAAVKKVETERGKIVWSKVTSLLGWTSTGPNNQRIKAILDKWDISY